MKPILEYLPWADTRDKHFGSRVAFLGGHFLAFLAMVGFSHVVLTRLGVEMFIFALAGIFFASIYAVISFRNLAIPFFVWILAIGGFRFLWSIQTPLLPDLYLDRMTMIWVTMVFMVKFFAEGRVARGPYRIEILLIAHSIYILVRIFMEGGTYFHDWTMSYLVPYTSFFMAKNIITRYRDIRLFLLVLLILSVYYNVTSIAEKMDLNWLLWPKYMTQGHEVFLGRSSGPFRQAPLFGTIIGMMLPLNLYFISTTRNALVRALLFLSLGMGLAGLYFTYTRGSWLAGAAALVTVVMLNRRAYLKMLLPVVVLAPMVAVLFLGAGQDQFLKERVENEDTLGSRFGTAVTVLRVFRDHPIFGVGFFQFREIRDQYVEPVTVPGMGTIRFVQFRHNAIHDIYLGPLAEDGIFGGIMQLMIYFFIYRQFRKKYRWRKQGDPFATFVLPVFGAFYIGYFVGGIAIDYRFFSFVGTLFYASAGILDAYQPETMDGSHPQTIEAKSA